MSAIIINATVTIVFIGAIIGIYVVTRYPMSPITSNVISNETI